MPPSKLNSTSTDILQVETILVSMDLPPEAETVLIND